MNAIVESLAGRLTSYVDLIGSASLPLPEVCQAQELPGTALGGKERATELPSGVINMGARVYDPYTATFLQTDPIPGADANAYGYTDGDPVNETDLSGDVCLRTPNGRCAVPPSEHAAKPKSSPGVVSQVFHFVTSTAPDAVGNTASTVVNKVVTHPVGDLLVVGGTVINGVTTVAAGLCEAGTDGLATFDCAKIAVFGYTYGVAAYGTAGADYSRKHGP